MTAMRTIVRMKVVLDTSAVLAVILREPERVDVISLTRECELLAPAVLPYEIGNALTGLLKRRIHTVEQTRAAWCAFNGVPLELRQIDVGSALMVAARQRLYAYDAYVIQCAIEARCQLLSLDKGQSAAAVRENVVLRRETQQ